MVKEVKGWRGRKGRWSFVRSGQALVLVSLPDEGLVVLLYLLRGLWNF
jgi:hypothetical protein